MNRKMMMSLSAGVAIVVIMIGVIFYEKFFSNQGSAAEVAAEGTTDGPGQSPESFGDEINRDQVATQVSPENLVAAVNKLKECLQLDADQKIALANSSVESWKAALQTVMGTTSKEDRSADELQLEYANGSNATLTLSQNIVRGLRVESEQGSLSCDAFDQPANCLCE